MNQTPKTSYNKAVMSMLLLIYIVAFILTSVMLVWYTINAVKNCLTIDSGIYISYFSFIGGPTATSVGFYCWKAKAENVAKIASKNSSEATETILRGASN